MITGNNRFSIDHQQTYKIDPKIDQILKFRIKQCVNITTGGIREVRSSDAESVPQDAQLTIILIEISFLMQKN